MKSAYRTPTLVFLGLAAIAATGGRAGAAGLASDLPFQPSGAPTAPPNPPPAGESLYLDWVSPLQAPRGLRMPPAGPVVAPLPKAAGGSAAAPPQATAVPEPASVALLALGALPFGISVLARRRSAASARGR